ncbi:MAG TPA: hypothetical protein DCW68_03370 [Rhodospirillaceae bacterium]|nr:MAG: hypothetical protein A2018_06345 [Alphaproteobacteria bacterium GWF2_58_20]HAU29133.1 hypothetical protein [Rhodospirillaceae bacterium]
MSLLRLRAGEFARHVVDLPGQHGLDAEVAAGARLDCIILVRGMARHDIHVRLMGEGAECHLFAAGKLGDGEGCDLVPVFEHVAPNTRSTQTVRLVAEGDAKVSCRGRVIIRAGAVKADGAQSAKGLLLSREAEINLSPELEIYADDVACRHGATVGDLDADSMFYLRSRGIPEEVVRQMLIHAFLGEAFAGVPDAVLRESLLEGIGYGL